MVRRALLAVAGLCVVAAGAFATGSLPPLDGAVDIFWTVLFWLLVAVLLVVLAWSVFPTPSR